jgi:hypothetical protein
MATNATTRNWRIQMGKSIATLIAVITLAAASTVDAEVILSSSFTGVDKTDGSAPYTATNITWDTVSGIDAPAGDLTFVDADTPTTNVNGFFDVTANEIDVNYNQTTEGPWQTEIALVLDSATASIDLTQIVLGMRLTNGSGADNSTSSKSGRMTVEVIGSSSGSLGVIDPGNLSYPSVSYTRTIDLSSFDSLTNSETYTLVIEARGAGHGHHKSLQNLSLEGDITPVPEPAALALLGLGGLVIAARRRE